MELGMDKWRNSLTYDESFTTVSRFFRVGSVIFSIETEPIPLILCKLPTHT